MSLEINSFRLSETSGDVLIGDVDSLSVPLGEGGIANEHLDFSLLELPAGELVMNNPIGIVDRLPRRGYLEMPISIRRVNGGGEITKIVVEAFPETKGPDGYRTENLLPAMNIPGRTCHHRASIETLPFGFRPSAWEIGARDIHLVP